MQKIVYLLFIVFLTEFKIQAQTLYSERFNNLSLTTASNPSNGSNYGYSQLSNGMLTINNGGFSADTLIANYPFKSPLQSKQAWLAYKTNTTTSIDTFAVSTSWLIPTGTASAWLITPLITNIAANSLLTWEAMAPDIANADGYEVYISTNTTTLVNVSDFSTQLYAVSSENSQWTSHGLSLAAFAGQSIRVAFKNNSTDKYQLWLDDIVVKNISNGNDVAAISNDTYKYGLTNINQTIVGSFQNNGYNAITSLVLNYKVGTNPQVSEVKTFSSPMNYLEVKQLTASIPFISSTVAYNDLKIWVSNINGQNDQLNLNDTAQSFLSIQSSIPVKKVLVEEFTSIHCGWCPEAQDSLIQIATTHTNVVVASIHQSDPYFSLSMNGIETLSSKSLPFALINRTYFSDIKDLGVDRFSWSNHIATQQNMVSPATVSITNVTYNSTTREITAIVSSTFLSNIKGDYRLNLYIKENNVYEETGNVNWEQASYFYNIPNSTYYQLGTASSIVTNPMTYLLNANQFKQQFVVNQMFVGPFGLSGVIPANALTAGQTYSTSFTYTLPTSVAGIFRHNDFNSYLVATVSEFGADAKQKTILNTTEVKLTTNPESTVGIKELMSNQTSINMYPNPASEACIVSYQLKEAQPVNINIYSALGELVLSEKTNASIGETRQVVNVKALAPGNYSVLVNFKNEIVTKKLTIIK